MICFYFIDRKEKGKGEGGRMIDLFNDDCLNVLKRMADNSVDLVLTDPPYGIGEANGKNDSRGKLAKTTKFEHKDWDKNMCKRFNEPVFTNQVFNYKCKSCKKMSIGNNDIIEEIQELQSKLDKHNDMLERYIKMREEK